MTTQSVIPGEGSRQAADHIAAEIRAELARQKLSIRQYATKMGVNHLWVNRRISTMKTGISPEDLEFLADGLGVPVWKLIPREWLPGGQAGAVGGANQLDGVTRGYHLSVTPTGCADSFALAA